MVDLMDKESKKLISGKNISYIDLPVRVFEARSVFERLCDHFGAAPYYLRIATN
jgi:hypothetical protein